MTREPILGTNTTYKKLHRLHTDQIVVSQLKAWEGAIARVTPEFDGWFLSPQFATFRAKPEKADVGYVALFLKLKAAWTQLANSSRGMGARRDSVSPKSFLALDLPLPAMAEQRRIVARIENLTTTISRARDQRLVSVAEADAITAAHSRERLNPGRGWRTETIEGVCDDIIDYRGRTPPISDAGLPHITSANIRNGRIDWVTTKFVSEETYADYMTRGIPMPGDVLFTMEAPLAEVGVVPDERRFSLAQRVILLRPDKSIVTGEYLAKALQNPDVRANIYSKATATTVQGIAAKRLRLVELPIPSLPEQRRIVAELDALQAEVDRLKQLQAQTAAELDALLPSILDRAFKGEL